MPGLFRLLESSCRSASMTRSYKPLFCRQKEGQKLVSTLSLSLTAPSLNNMQILSCFAVITALHLAAAAPQGSAKARCSGPSTTLNVRTQQFPKIILC